MKSENTLRSVMFLAGKCGSLLRKGDPYGQLDGVLELMQFSDSYVLNDRTTVGGISWAIGDDELSKSIIFEAALSETVETIGYGTQNCNFDIGRFENALGLPEMEKRIREMYLEFEEKNKGKEVVEDIPKELGEFIEHARILQQQTYILMADALSANYVTERYYGKQALDAYPNILMNSPHLLMDNLREKINSEMEHDFYSEADEIFVPSFFTEALRNSETTNGVYSALRQLRNSRSAKRYRFLLRTYLDTNLSRSERKESLDELRNECEAISSGEGVKSRVPMWFKWTTGLASGVTALVFPEAGLVPGVIEGLDQLDKFVRKRSNIFGIYSRLSGVDLYRELKRVFPNVSFGPEHLSYFLKNRNFGWKDQDSLYKYLLDENN